MTFCKFRSIMNPHRKNQFLKFHFIMCKMHHDKRMNESNKKAELMLKIRATAVCNSHWWTKTKSSAITKKIAQPWLKIIKEIKFPSEGRIQKLMMASQYSVLPLSYMLQPRWSVFAWNTITMTVILPLKGVQNFRWKETSPPTIVGVKELECFCYLTVKTAWSYLHSSRYNTSGRTDRIVVGDSCLALCTVARKNDRTRRRKKNHKNRTVENETVDNASELITFLKYHASNECFLV